MTELPRIYYNKDEYFETANGNRIAKNCNLLGSVNIILNGKVTVMDHCTLRGDLNMIRIGMFSVVRENCIIRPSYKLYRKGLMFYTIQIGSSRAIHWPDDWTVATLNGKNSAQFEHMILVTDDGYEILTERDKKRPWFMDQLGL